MHSGKNLKEFQEIYKNKDNEIYSQLNKEVQTMAERYVSKLIPRQRRIYLPKVQRFEDVQIIYREADSEKNIIDSWNIGGFDKKDDLVEQSESNGTGYKKRQLFNTNLEEAKEGSNIQSICDRLFYLTLIHRQFCSNLALVNHNPNEVMRISAIFPQKN